MYIFWQKSIWAFIFFIRGTFSKKTFSNGFALKHFLVLTQLLMQIHRHVVNLIKQFTIVIYDSRVVLTRKLPILRPQRGFASPMTVPLSSNLTSKLFLGNPLRDFIIKNFFSYRKKIIFQTCFIASSVRICDKFLNVVTFVTIQLTVDLLGSSLFSFFHC